MSDTQPTRTNWQISLIPQHVVMEMWKLEGTDSAIIWGINLHADGDADLPYWVEYYPHYSATEERQECVSEDFAFYEELAEHIQHLMDMSDDEYIDKSATHRNQFFNNIAEIMMYIW